MHRDTSFWWAVGALAVATLALTLHHGSREPTEIAPSSARSASSPPHVRHERSSEAATLAASASVHHAAAPEGRTPTATASTASSSESDPSAEQRARRAAAREALAELVRASRERRRSAARSTATAELDPRSGMPLADMSFEQYRTWAKLGTMIAERDYRSVAEHEPPLSEVFDESTVEAMVDAIVEDYSRYLGEVSEQSCAAIEPSSLWRKTAFMGLWLGRLGRHSVELAAEEQEALRACGYG